MAKRKILSGPAMLLLGFLILSACTKSSGPSNAAAPVVISSLQTFTLQKTQGINVGEANAVWGVGMLAPEPNTVVLNVVRISLAQGANYSKQSWTIPMSGNLNLSGTGTRTFLSQWGFLICRGSNSTGDVGLYAVDSVLNTWTQIYETNNGSAGGRCSAFGYNAQGSDGKNYSFVAFAYMGADGATKIERFLVNTAASNLASRFTRVTPYSAVSPNLNSATGFYNGFLFPNQQPSGAYLPRFFGGIPAAGAAGGLSQVQGYDLTVDVPPTPLGNPVVPITPTLLSPPNVTFVSSSHPPTGGPFGSIGLNTYSMAGDPIDGYLYISDDPTDGGTFMSYDSVNKIVFRANRASMLTVTGAIDSSSTNSMLAAFKRGCFYDPTLTNCNPLTTTNSQLYADVGPGIGPSSDLGNGCVAIIALKRPGEGGVSTDTFQSPVYTACVRDANDLTKGVSVTQISTVTGATYMYNDFTGGSTNLNLPTSILFDFSALHVTGFSAASFYWVSSDSSTSLAGVSIAYRCYPKGVATPPPFQPYPGTFPNASIPTPFPKQCGATPGTNQVEFQLSHIPGKQFTHLALFSVSVQQ